MNHGQPGGFNVEFPTIRKYKGNIYGAGIKLYLEK